MTRPQHSGAAACGEAVAAPAHHALVITADEIRLVHPIDCTAPATCAEGSFAERDGLARYASWPVGTHDVAWYGAWTGDEWDEGLGRAYDSSLVDPLPPPATPVISGPVRGFPYAGGRWGA